MNQEMTPETIVRELVATELHRRKLLNMLEEAVGRPVRDPSVFRYSHLVSGAGGTTFGEGFNLADEEVATLLEAAFARGR